MLRRGGRSRPLCLRNGRRILRILRPIWSRGGRSTPLRLRNGRRVLLILRPRWSRGGGSRPLRLRNRRRILRILRPGWSRGGGSGPLRLRNRRRVLLNLRPGIRRRQHHSQRCKPEGETAAAIGTSIRILWLRKHVGSLLVCTLPTADNLKRLPGIVQIWNLLAFEMLLGNLGHFVVDVVGQVERVDVSVLAKISAAAQALQQDPGE